MGNVAAGGMDAVTQHLSRWSSAVSALQAPTLQELRAAFARYPISSEAPADVAQTSATLAGVEGTWFRPRSTVAGRRIVYIHGGGFWCGEVEMYAGLCGKLAEAARADLFFADYRRAPEHRHPAALEDVVSVLRAAAAEGPEGAGAVGRLGLAGDSSGAGLGLAAAMALRDAGHRGPGAISCFSGWFDFGDLPPDRPGDVVVTQAAMESAVAMYFADGAPAGASPLRGDLLGLPPLLIQVSGEETLLPQSRALAEKAGACGISVSYEVLPPELPHVGQVFWRESSTAHAALERAGRFLAGEA